MATAEQGSIGANGAVPADDSAGELVASLAQAQAISADEIALYDRQIRLWGVQAQEKIRTANILLLRAKALANEVAKNLVLAGIASITVVDHENVTEEDLGAQFFVSEEQVGQNRAEAAAPQIQKLNPRVNVTALNQDPGTLEPDFFNQFTLVVATDLDFVTLTNINAITRVTNKPLYAAGGHGMYGYIFADLIMHTYQIERSKSNKPTVIGPESPMRSIVSTSEKKEDGKTIELVTKQELYSPLLLVNSSPLPLEMSNNARKMRNVTPLLPCLRALWEFQKTSNGSLPTHSRQDLATFTRLATEKVRELQLPADILKSEFLRSFLQNLGTELAPVTAFLGGMVAQDAINVLGQRQQPIQNLVLFDGEESKGPVYAIHPQYDATLDPMNGMNGMNGLNGMNGINGLGADGMGMGMGMGDLSAGGMLPTGMDGTYDMNMAAMQNLQGMNGMDMTTMLDMNSMAAMGDMTAFGGMPMGSMGMDMGNGMMDMSAMSGIPGMTMNADGLMHMPGGTETTLDIPVVGEDMAQQAVQDPPTSDATQAQISPQPQAAPSQDAPQQAGDGGVPNALGANDGPNGEKKLEGEAAEVRKPISQQ